MSTALTCALLLLAPACGAGPDETAAPTSGSPTPEAPYVPGSPANEVRPATAREQATWPTCDQVWQRPGRIPARYRGCVSGDRAVVADLIDCSFGGAMTTYDDRFYGVVGNVVLDAGESLATNRRYARNHALCTG